jgi:flagellar hook-associated protein 1 FlgK
MMGQANTLYLPPSSTGISDASYSVVLSGNPLDGDVFTLSKNLGATSDNTNGLLLANIMQQKLFSGGNENITQVYSNLSSRVGGITSDAQTRQSSSGIILQQAQNYQQSISGVSLDEEASNLLQYQQCYSAAAKLVTVAKQMMDTLLNNL